jgi:NAD(P)-dependent dehydrogenase (short-subunit alcohol dehydrogenase family)
LDIKKMASYPSLRDRVIVVTGGASGIGEAIVEAFAMQNSRVAFLDIQDATADLLVHRIKPAGFTPPAYFHCDLSDIAAIKASVEDILERFNTVDVLVNNAGNDSRHSIEEVTPEYWDQAMAVNLKHQFFMGPGSHPIHEKSELGIDYQHELDQLGYSVNRFARICHSKGRCRRIDPHASP